jgi:starch-binding outer membrane protein, SusD/RagB family
MKHTNENKKIGRYHFDSINLFFTKQLQLRENLLKYMLMLALAVFFVGCNKDWLEVTPKGTELEENYYRNADEAFAGLVAIYDQVGGTSNGYINKFTVTLSASDDHFAGGGGPTDVNNLQVISNYTLDPATGPQGELWDRGFSGVFRANVLISKLPDIPMDENLKKRYMAESKFLRAYFYFDLVRFFKNIPLFKEPLSASDMYNVVQADPSDVYSFIIQDLQDAIADLPPTVPVDTEGGRATEGAASALLGKVYLQLEDYTLAAEQFNKVNGEPGGTSQFGYRLLPNFNDLWDFDNKQNSESIFTVNHTGKAQWDNWGCIACAEGNWINTMCAPRNYNRLDTIAPDYFSGWSFFVITNQLESFMQGDPRYDYTIADIQALEDDGLITYEKGYQNTGFFIKKFIPLQSDVNEGGNVFGNFDQNIYDIRLADTYLMEAEALVSSGGDISRAQSLLDAVRQRVGLESVPVSLEAIKNERRLELAGEGHRWFDLVRWGDAAEALAFKGFVAGRNEILPIPLLELENTLLEQNMEYGGTQ